MQIVVLVGRVLDPAGIAVNRRAGRVFVNRETYVMQPADACALEAALRIKDGNPEAGLLVLPRHPLPDDDVLRQALAAGADHAILLDGEDLAGADDAAMARLLAAVVSAQEGVQLVLTGAVTLDTGQAQLGPRLAAQLVWTPVVGAWDVRVSGDSVQVVRREAGTYVIYETGLPAVVTVAADALRLRYPDGARLIATYRDGAAVERWQLADLRAGGLWEGEAPGPLVEQRGQDVPPPRERGVRLAGTPAEMARALAAKLRS